MTPELEKTLPVGWMHVPKCGTSFLNTLIHLPGVCPEVPDDIVVSQETFPEKGSKFISVFNQRYNVPDSCPGFVNKDWGHHYLKEQENYTQLTGHFMTMLRNPEQRILAAYYDLLYCSATEPMDNLLDEKRSWGGLKERRIPWPSEFALSNRGCTVKMLTRPGYRCGDGVPPTEAEVKEAKDMIHTEFSFIGMTDDWNLSICLLSAMFKVPCLRPMFEDVRTARENNTEKYDLAPLMGVTDPFDGEVFAEATKIFNERKKQYNVSEASCRETCWREAGLLAD